MCFKTRSFCRLGACEFYAHRSSTIHTRIAEERAKKPLKPPNPANCTQPAEQKSLRAPRCKNNDPCFQAGSAALLSLLCNLHDTTDLSDRLRNKNNSIHSKGLKWITSLPGGPRAAICFHIFAAGIDKTMINDAATFCPFAQE